ncbi:MAG TPA: serine dehydratase [Balneolaceae bacterium]|nr:serine dehydratase [Balneolaceae bacterium]|tara:strand:+ start:12321 stop:13274 length:954 start_codon:yes stop_codon:yes gene_type:complete
MKSDQVPSFSDIKEAQKVIAPFAHRTPVLSSTSINKITGSELLFKSENFQKVGAFKFRGACNAVMSLSDEDARKGVATHSSGNHAQALALAAKLRGIPAHVVMPENAPKVKVAAVKDYGAEITFCEATLPARESTLAEVIEKTGAQMIHPYNNAYIIAGQGTAALELLEDHPDLDVILAPVGGGGLMSGTAIASKGIKPSIKVIGTEPELADDAYRSFKAKKLIPLDATTTIADGLRTSLGTLTFEAISEYVDEIVTVSEEGIIAAMRLIWERMNIIIEPSCAVPLAAVLEKNIDLNGKKAGIILSGGNVDLDQLPW